MSTIYGIQKPPESRDERPFIIARNSKERARCRSAKNCLPAFYRALLSALGLRNFLFKKCSLLAEIGLAEAAGAHLT